MTYTLTTTWIATEKRNPTSWSWATEPAWTVEHGRLLVRHPDGPSLSLNLECIAYAEFVVQ